MAFDSFGIISALMASQSQVAVEALIQVAKTYAEKSASEKDASVEKSDAAAVESMRETAKELDPELQGPARRVIEANLDWVAAEGDRLQALAINDQEGVAKARRTQQRLEREIQTFELMKGMHEATKATSQTLEEIKGAREQADIQQGKQNTFNKRMTFAAILLAAGSVVMPFVEEFYWKDPPPKPSVVVVQESDLTVPPLLRNVGP